MSTSGQFPFGGPGDLVEQLREELRESHSPMSEAVLNAAYDACEIDTPTLFAYFEGSLGAQERREVEALAAASPHLLSKLARVGKIVADTRAGGQAGR